MSKRTVTILKSRLSNIGGVEKYTWRIAKAFSERNCQVNILTTGNCPSQEGINIISLDRPRFLSFFHLKQFEEKCCQWLKDNPTDIIFGMDRNSHQTHYRAGNGVHAAYLSRRSRESSLLKKISFSLNPLHRFLLDIEQRAYENPHLRQLFTNSEMVRQEILQYYATPPKKIVTIHNGVEWKEMCESFKNWPHLQEKAKKNLSLNAESFQFLFVGNGFQRKGLHLLLEGLSKIKQERWELCVVGKDKKRKKFISLAKKLCIADRVKFLGQCKNMKTLYQLADALVIPSLYDPFANVTVEALAMGLFVISSKSNGGHEILCRENGIVIEDLHCPLSLSKALRTALSYKKTLSSSQRIRQSVRHLDFSEQIKKIIDTTLGIENKKITSKLGLT